MTDKQRRFAAKNTTTVLKNLMLVLAVRLIELALQALRQRLGL